MSATAMLPTTTTSLRSALSRFTPDAPILLDTETTGLNPRLDKLILVQIAQPAWADDPLLLDWRQGPPQDGDDRLLSKLLRRCGLVAHNALFDMQFLHSHGVTTGRVYCTQIAQQVLRGVGKEDARVQGVPLTLAGIAAEHGIPVSKEERSWFIGLDTRPDEWAAPCLPDEQLAYAARDITALAAVYDAQHDELAIRPKLREPLDIEMRCLPAIAAMQEHGVLVDVDRWRAVIAGKDREAAGLEDDVLQAFGPAILLSAIAAYDQGRAAFAAWETAWEAALAEQKRQWEANPTDADGEPQTWVTRKAAFTKSYRQARPRPARPKLDLALPNVGSSTQLLTAFARLGIPARSTEAKALAPLEDRYPALKTLSRYRKARKFVTSFGEKLLAHVEPDGRIHPQYHPIGASTGRMSCVQPNWQQVPSRGDGRKLRACVRAAPGHRLVVADFSNIELRILAEYSRDARLLDMFAREVDLHSEVARLMFHLDADVDPRATACPTTPGWTYRDVSKTINYGLVYGMSSRRLASTMRVSPADGQELMDAYFALFPGVVAWLERARAAGLKRRASYTMSHRVRIYRNLPDILSEYERERLERQCANSPIQGTNADITKLAVALYHEEPSTKKGRLVAVVHDELVCEAAEDWARHTALLLASSMNEAAETYLKTVALPWPTPTISEQWEH